MSSPRRKRGPIDRDVVRQILVGQGWVHLSDILQTVSAVVKDDRGVLRQYGRATPQGSETLSALLHAARSRCLRIVLANMVWKKLAEFRPDPIDGVSPQYRLTAQQTRSPKVATASPELLLTGPAKTRSGLTVAAVLAAVRERAARGEPATVDWVIDRLASCFLPDEKLIAQYVREAKLTKTAPKAVMVRRAKEMFVGLAVNDLVHNGHLRRRTVTYLEEPPK
jgi:hypothetical protein